jgi:predicted component of viral defense system (DUF524 family)
MDLLTIVHRDFRMIIECGHFDAIWEKAKRNVGEDNLTSTYSWSEGVVSVTRQCRNGERQAIVQGVPSPAIFFDNTEYPIWVEFDSSVRSAYFGSILQGDNDNFSFRKGILAGFINFGNEIGKSEIVIEYYKDSERHRFRFSFEVLSPKLNYHEHWKQIIEDIESEYRMLSLDYLKRTFHSFTPDTSGDNQPLIWWSIFAEEQNRFIKAVKAIIERPRHRLHGIELYLRADKLKRVPVSIENELAEHRKEPAHLYRIEQQVQSNDTQENRFLKHALSQITSKYEALKKKIEANQNSSSTLKANMRDTLETLKQLNRNPFFRTVGNFKGLTQESLVLQKATGYSQVYRTWGLLLRAYSLNDGIYHLQTKDIATLYEIWCFIEVSHIVRELLGEDTEVIHHKRTEMNGIFTWSLGKGEHSRILFKKDNVELAELVYNPKQSEKENRTIGMKNLVSRTVPQKPDIVLQLTKQDYQRDIKLTYLFDAKYRIESKMNNGVDTPPDDAINQMHRYRDAIYYKEYSSDELKKEVIGGYILFPGDGQKADVEVSYFYKAINEVNIGAFPLRPKDKENRDLLVKFIETLIGESSYSILEKTIPQKGLKYSKEVDGVLILTNPSGSVQLISGAIKAYPAINNDGMDLVSHINDIKYVLIHNTADDKLDMYALSVSPSLEYEYNSAGIKTTYILCKLDGARVESTEGITLENLLSNPLIKYDPKYALLKDLKIDV